MRHVATLLGLLVLVLPAAAGELVLTNGSRLEADLASEMILLSTGAELVEVAPETIGLLTPVEIRLKDGRLLRGTLVGDRVKARTHLGELAVRIDELQSFSADGATPAAAVGAPAPAPAPPVPQPAAPRPSGGPLVLATTGPAAVLARTAPGPPLEVVVEEIPLLRDALTNAAPVGKVVQGQRVTYVDSIDRRLHIFNTLVFDGGHWIKVRITDGTEGWLPASSVREMR